MHPVIDLSALEHRLRDHVAELAGTIGERNVWRPRALRAAARYIRAAFAQAGCEVDSQGYDVDGLRCENLVVTLPGRGREGDMLVVGAHYDTVRGSPGADDNASGVAALIEIARALRPQTRLATVRLVAFVNEEPPFFSSRRMGSWIYADAARRRGDDIRWMLSLEMLGCYCDDPGSQSYPPLLGWFYPRRGNFVAFVSNLRSRRALAAVADAFRACSDFPAERLASPAWVPGVAWSDQLSFWRAGYRALMATDTAFYRYAHYHAGSDTPDKLAYRPMARVTAGLAAAIGRLAGSG